VAYPKAKNKIEYLFSDIEDAVLNDETDAGLIIHENRFTYAAKGLHKIVDLGEYWEKETASPVPLGGIVIKRELPPEIQKLTQNLLRESVQYAFNNPGEATGFVKMFAQEMDEDVMYKHIALYVNDYTLSLGTKGKNAINTLYGKALRLELVKPVNRDFFLDSNKKTN
jgi:1,4-dihydroxy-6-naphthoate synthase